MTSRRTLLKTAAALSAAATPALSWNALAAQDATPVATPVAVDPPQALLPSDWGRVEGQTATINGVDIYYEIYGEGEPVFLLHGGLGDGTSWANQIPEFAEHYQLIVPDTRGHGQSTFDETPIGYSLIASDVIGLADLLGIDTFDIVGWSDGGIVGLELALTHPERLGSVVAFGANFDPTGVRTDIAESAYFGAYISRAAEDYQTISPEPERWDEFLTSIGNMWATEPNYTVEQLGAITTPILVLAGHLEEAIDEAHTIALAEAIPDSELAILPGTGHFAHIEKPEIFNAIVLDFLASNA